MPDGTNQPTTSSGTNKWIYIAVGVVVVLALLGFMMRGAGFMAMRAAGVDVQPGLDGSATYTGNDGSSVTVGGNKMPDTWPSDAPANYTGATIGYSGSSNPQTGQAGAAVMYTVKATASAVLDYYKQQFTAGGWTVENTANVGAMSMLSAKKGEREMAVTVTDAGDGTVQVSAGLNL